jgi:hypothetical protein
MMLVTLRGCHLLDGLVACNSVEARKKLVQCFRGGFEGVLSSPHGSHEEQL